MGTRSDLSRTLNQVRAIAATVAVVALAGCIDFVDPNIPDAGGPAILNATAVVSDRGSVDIRGSLDPGIALSGVRRAVPAPALEANDTAIEPDQVRRDGRRFYEALLPFDPASEALTISFLAPPVPGVEAPRPAARLFGIRRVGPDTLRLAAGEDLLLRITPEPGTSQPPPAIQQWFLTLSAASNEFRLGGNGPPPDTILIPTRFIPTGDSLEVRLIYQQFVDVQTPPGDYIGLFTLDARTFWTVRVDDAAHSHSR